MLKYLISGLALSAFLAWMGFCVWLFGTTAGAVWMMETVSRHTTVKISSTAIEGFLAGSLRLENLEIVWPQGSARIQNLAWRARPLDLLTGRLGMQHVTLSEVEISDRTPEAPPEIQWPAASGLIRFSKATIERLDISRLTYRHLEKEPVYLETCTASVVWQSARLSVVDLHLASGAGILEGNILAGFGRPLLEMNVQAKPTRPIADLDTFRLSATFGPGKPPEQIAGSLHLTGSLDGQTVWDMTSDAGMTSDGFPLRNMRLHRPDQEGQITATGMLTLSGPEPHLAFHADATNMDADPLVKLPGKLSGALTFAGTSTQYAGHITLTHQAKDWKTVSLKSDYTGNHHSLTLQALQGEALKGTIDGSLHIDWQNDTVISGSLSGRNFDPSVIDESWTGVIHFDLTAGVSAGAQKPVQGNVLFTLHESMLHGQKLVGNARATFTDNDMRIQNLTLQGKGFQISAAGAVNRKLDFTARIEDLSRLIPKTAGSLSAQGWARWREGKPGGVIAVQARNLAAYGLEISTADIKAALEDQGTTPLSLRATLNNLRFRGFTADALTLKGTGSRGAHTLSATLRRNRHETHLALSGVYSDVGWQGKILRLDGTDEAGPWKLVRPAALAISENSLTIEPMMMTGVDAETLHIAVRLDQEPLSGSLDATWQNLNPARANAWMHETRLSGLSSGNIRLEFLPENHMTLSGKATLSGTIQTEGQSIGIRQGEITYEANEKGTRADADIHLTQGGRLQGAFSSPAPARPAWPVEGLIDLSWRDMDLGPLSAWLPRQGKLTGLAAGKASGKLLPGLHFDLTGRTSVAQSKFTWQGERGDVSVDLRQASLDWTWREETLKGAFSLTLAEHGKLRGLFNLPIAARYPIVLDTTAKMEASLAGQVREKGSLGVLFPGLIQESRGDLDVDLKMRGTGDAPEILGRARLSGAGGYLPGAGITIRDAQMAVRLDQNTIHIDSFRAASGPGHIEGAAVIRTSGWRVTDYEGHLDGSRFQTIYLPELQVQTSPKLTFSGTTDKLSVRGEVLLPQVSVIGTPSRGPVTASPDVIVEGRTAAAKRDLPLDMDVDIRLIMGDQVLFQAGGIDAQLAGGIDLKFQNLDKIGGHGEIRVVQGRFRTYGVNLNIVRGRLFYAGGPINQPAVDVLALRTVGDVRAGVIVSGMLPHPVVKLYSEPFMQDMDILAYIVLGHPLGSDSAQANLMIMAAGALLTSTQAEKVLREMKNRLGLDTFQIAETTMAQNNLMGYKRIDIAQAGTQAQGNVTETMLVVGKYLTPKLYISYGRALFSGGNLLLLRYDLSKNWQVESQTGTESGIDIYYKLEFN
ncbi:MAG: translocation/assembly module TamB domain-containing protein [Smithellaceae bacterium]